MSEQNLYRRAVRLTGELARVYEKLGLDEEARKMRIYDDLLTRVMVGARAFNAMMVGNPVLMALWLVAQGIEVAAGIMPTAQKPFIQLKSGGISQSRPQEPKP
jgi:hypothetical protein